MEDKHNTENNNGRTIVGLTLAISVIYCLYFGYIKILFIAISAAVLYDVWYMLIKLRSNICLLVVIYFLMHNFNIYLANLYNRDPIIVIIISTITQTSDVYQYLAGKYFGKNKIGWISKNKTYEGYVIGLLFTVVTFLPMGIIFGSRMGIMNQKICPLEDKIVQWAYYFLIHNQQNDQIWYITKNIVFIYLLGVLGGLVSSLFKRILMIKDYSDLLGSHGGWMDRIDSIVLPILFYSVFC